MTDFLGRLASRALGIAPVIQPRARSRFEPDSAPLLAVDAERASAPADTPRTTEAPRGSGMKVALPAAAASGSRRHHTQPMPPLMLRQVNPEPSPRVQDRPPWHSDALIDFPVGPASARSPAGKSQDAGPLEESAPADPPIADTQALERVHAASHGPSEAARVAAQLPRDPEWTAKADTGSVERRTRSITAAFRDDEADSTADRSVAETEPQAGFPVRSPAMHKIAVAPPAASAAGADQNIVIEIGSIELRTQAAAPLPAAPVPRSVPALSLDAYLLRRGAS